MDKLNNQQDLNQKLWAAANILRGRMDANEFKDYILGFIFFKFLSEDFITRNDFGTVKDYKKYYDNSSPQEKDKIQNYILENRGYFLKPGEFFSDFIDRINSDQTIIEELIAVFHSIEQRTYGKKSEIDFNGLFENIDLNSKNIGSDYNEKNRTIASLIQKINEIDFENNFDLLGNAYEYLISQFASDAGKKGGEFYTPDSVSKLIAKITTAKFKHQPKTIYDPTCGSGSLLIKTFSELNDKSVMIYGQELNHTTYNLARMNMFLHLLRFDDFEIRQGDTLLNDQFSSFKFDIIVANPPFGTKWNPPITMIDDPRFSGYDGAMIPNSKAELAFVQHMIFHLADEGIVATVMPHGVLSRRGKEAIVRRHLIESNNYLDAVIDLPTNLFFGTPIPAVIMIFNKSRKSSDGVLFIDGSKEFEKVKNQNKLTTENIEKIFDTYFNKIELEKYSRLVTLKEIRENEFNLNINRYIDSYEEEILPDYDDLLDKLAAIKAEKSKLQILINNDLERLGLRKIE